MMKHDARILVVDDDALLAIDLADHLTQVGFNVVGPVASVASALSTIASEGCDAAVLDVNLGAETAEPIARKLLALGIPFMMVTGYDYDQLAPIFGGLPIMTKPIEYGKVVALLRQL